MTPNIRTISGTEAIAAVFRSQTDQLKFVIENQRNFEPCHFSIGSKKALLTSDPMVAQHVLQKQAWNYRKSSGYDGLRRTLGNGLVTSEGDFWRRQRKLAQPAFHKSMLAQFVSTMSEMAEDMLTDWRQGPIDVLQQMSMLTMRIIAQTMFSSTIDKEGDALSRAFDAMMEYSHVHFLFAPPDWLPTKKSIEGKKAIKFLHEHVKEIIKERQASGALGNDFLGMFMSAGESTSDKMNNQQLRDEMMTIFAAGHETTAVAMSWLFHHLDQNPTVLEKVESEIAEVLGDAPITLEKLAQLEYTERTIKESMRVSPPVWAFDREAIADDVVCGHEITAGTMVLVSPYMLHRNPEHWDAPEVFNPDRFLLGKREHRHRYSYLPFGGGPRICIGANFAMMETKIIAALVLRKFRLTGQKQKLDYHVGITLRPEKLTMNASSK